MRIALTLVSLLFVVSCFQPQTIHFLDDGNSDQKNSIRYEIAHFLIEKGYGHNVAYVTADQQPDVVAKADGTFNVSDRLEKIIPDVIDTLKKITLDDTTISECLAWMNENTGADMPDVVLHFFINHKLEYKKWLPDSAYRATQNTLSQKFKISKFQDTL